MSHLIETDDFLLEYEIFGSGAMPLIAFHGYDRDCNDFRILLPSLGRRYTVYAINIFFHGASRPRRAGAVMREADFVDLVVTLMKKHGFGEFAVIGYSLGGKLACKLIECMPGKVTEAFLIAPEGLKVNLLYRLVSETAAGLWLFRVLMRLPVVFYLAIVTARALGGINEKQYRFVLSSIDSPAKRMRIWRLWKVLMKLAVNPEKLASALRKNSIQAHFFFGQYDRIVPASVGEDFVHALSDNCRLHILEMNHQLLHERLNGVLAEVLSDL